MATHTAVEELNMSDSQPFFCFSFCFVFVVDWAAIVSHGDD